MEATLLYAERLADIGGIDLYDRGKIREAYSLSKKALEVLDKQGALPATPLRSDALTIIGLCTDVMNIDKRKEGLDVRRKCLKIRETCLGQIPPATVTLEDKIRLCNSYTDLVCSLQHLYDFEEVERNCETCLSQYTRWGSEDELPYEYAKYYNHMAYVHLFRNEGDKAVEFAKKGYELVEKASPGAQINVLYKYD